MTWILTATLITFTSPLTYTSEHITHLFNSKNQCEKQVQLILKHNNGIASCRKRQAGGL